MKLHDNVDWKKVSIVVAIVSLAIIIAFGFHVYVFKEFYEAVFVANNIHLGWGPLILLFLFCNDVTILIIKFISLYFTLPFTIPMDLIWLVVADWCVLMFVKILSEGVVNSIKEVSK